MSAVHLDLVLTPNRSLSPDRTRWLIAGVAAVMALAGLRVLLLGAWPVIPFMVVDVALLAWALRASHASGRAFETVRLDDWALTVTKVTAAGVRRRITLEPWSVRPELEEGPLKQNRLWLRSDRRRVAVGSFLSPRERAEIYEVLVAALERLRLRGR